MIGRTQLDGNGETIELPTSDSIILQGNVSIRQRLWKTLKCWTCLLPVTKAIRGSAPLRKIPKNTAWIVAQYEVFWPTSNFGARPVLTKPRSGNISVSRIEDTPAFRDRFQVK